ncbi:MAG: DUF748 domain-containing protein, partial [Verrucomicrobia bacterium]|nr:DUF748 domain-containing protein [Verrucomicrobiota bacterium]
MTSHPENRRKGRWWRWPLMALLSLGLLYLLLGFVLLPLTAKLMGPGLARDHLRGEVSVGAVWVNPLTFVISVKNFAWTDGEGGELASFEHFRVNADPLGSLFSGEWQVREIALRNASVDVHIDEEGRINLAEAVVEKTETPPSEESTPEAGFSIPALWLGELSVEGLAVRLTDLTRPEPFEKVLAPIHFRIENFHTKQDADNRYAFSARTREEEEI